MNTVSAMNGSTKVVTIGDLHITVCRLKYGGQIERNLMYRKFVHDHDDLEFVRWNLVCLSTQTQDGAPIELAHSSDTDAEFDAKVAALLELDNDVVEAWVMSVGEMLKPLVERAQLPLEMLTDEEKADPNSASAGRKSKRKSGAGSDTKPLANSA